MGEVDRRGRLDDTPFDYAVTKDDKARKFLAQVEGVDERDAQLVMAKFTGNFKRGNER